MNKCAKRGCQNNKHRIVIRTICDDCNRLVSEKTFNGDVVSDILKLIDTIEKDIEVSNTDLSKFKEKYST